MSRLSGKAKAKARKDKQKQQKLGVERKQKKNREKILTLGNPILKEKCDLVTKEDDLSFIEDLKKVLCSTKYGVGLSASQIGITKRAFVIRPDPKVNALKVIMNPKIINDDFAKIKAKEGCLSYPGNYYKIARPWKVEVEYVNEKFYTVKKELTGYEARVFLHEYDHTLGVCAVGDRYLSEKLQTKISMSKEKLITS